MSENDLAFFRNRTFGFVFQSFHLIPSLTALENVMFPAELAQDPKARTKALDLLKQLGVAHRSDRFPYQLSGGEKQRVAIGRALVNEPEILFADEPTGNLDAQNSRGIITLLESAYRARAMTLVMVTHNEAIAERADRRLTLIEGRLTTESGNAP
jgi:putative ABC transport system ATP-binding protein